MKKTWILKCVISCVALLAGCGDVTPPAISTGGMGGDGGSGGVGGTGGIAGAGGGVAESKVFSLGCTSNLPSDIIIVEWELTVATDRPVAGGAAFDATVDGTAFIPESIPDAVQTLLPGGAKSLDVAGWTGTVFVRSGATGESVTLGPTGLFQCAVGGDTCDPANSDPATGANSDCVPNSESNRCLQRVTIPTSDDCAMGGECEALGKIDQCAANGFCVTGPLPLEFEAEAATYTANTAGEILFGWDDESTGVMLNGDGTYVLPAAQIDSPIGPNGLRVLFGLEMVLQCTMGVDSDGPHGVGVPDQVSPTPDELLLSIPIVE